MPKKDDTSHKSTTSAGTTSNDAVLAAIAKQGAELAKVCELMQAMKESMEGRFDSIEKSLSNLQRDQREVKQRLEGVDEALTSADARIAALQSVCGELQDSNAKLKAKILDLEGRSRRMNIRIVGIPEGEEKGRPTEFISGLIPEIMGEENFGKPLKVERAYRVPNATPKATDKPRTMVATLHHYADVGKIFRLGRQLGSLKYGGKPIHIFPDFAPEIVSQRMSFNNVKRKLKDAGAQCSFRFPAKLQVVHDGKVQTFNSVSDAERFAASIHTNQ